MKDFPDEALTKKGEVRVLIDKGKFFRYQYIKDGKTLKKYSLILGKEHYFVIPLKENKSLLIKLEDIKNKKVFDEKTKKLTNIA